MWVTNFTDKLHEALKEDAYIHKSQARIQGNLYTFATKICKWYGLSGLNDNTKQKNAEHDFCLSLNTVQADTTQLILSVWKEHNCYAYADVWLLLYQ